MLFSTFIETGFSGDRSIPTIHAALKKNHEVIFL